ncbi:MAG TPA: isoprenylcysteine carboxylmethyltransferase family protein [Steroidobacteraceae bacterium]|nr:isoprenylcysteine carboxylmethyltransferase family protein [Steroidobacteraceae bacterium]
MPMNADRAHALELKLPPAVVLLLVAFGMWLLGRVGPPLPLTDGVRALLAAGLLAAGIAVAAAGVVTFRRARTTVNPMQPDRVSSMVTDGIYRHSRNPMYLGMLLVLAAWAAWLASVPALLGLPVFVLYLTRFQIVPEERVLAQRFAVQYADYARSTRRWI